MQIQIRKFLNNSFINSFNTTTSFTLDVILSAKDNYQIATNMY